MTDKKVDADDALQARGELAAEAPQVEGLVAYYKRLSRKTNPARRRKLVLQKARKLGLALGGNRLFDGPEIPQRVLDAPVWDGLRWLLDGAALLFGPMTVQQVLLKVSAVSGLQRRADRSVPEQRPADGSDWHRHDSETDHAGQCTLLEKLEPFLGHPR